MQQHETTGGTVMFMPDGRPAPGVLTTEETIAFLRLDPARGRRTLRYWKDEGLLKGCRMGRRSLYPLVEVMRFLARKCSER